LGFWLPDGVVFNSGQPGEVRNVRLLLYCSDPGSFLLFGQAGGLLVALLASLANGSLVITNADLIQTSMIQRLMFQIVYFNVVAW
jgi:hypothetical protein